LLNELARDTYDYEKFAVITLLMWEAIENERPAAWRVVFKGLSLLEHLIKNGSERCVDDARSHNHTLRTLLQFNYYEGTIDRGLGVREKTKQLIDVLGDDERIREERQKARKLREKFGNATGSASGGGGGGGMGSSGPYAGYGNDNWDRNNGGGGGGGYGDGGIGSKVAGRYDDERNSNSGNGGYSGRYDNETSVATTAAHTTITPTFATLSDDVAPKKTKGKKKKKETTTTTEATGGEVDLFSFDDPTPVAPPTASTSGIDDDFDTFQSAAPTGSTNTTSTMNDPFGGSTGIQPTPVMQFDAFSKSVPLPATNNMMQQPTTQFDAFASSGASNNIMGGGNSMMMQQQQQPIIGGNTMMGFNSMNGGGMQQQKQQQQQHFQVAAPDDDFGDFAAATTPTTSSGKNAMPSNSSNPLNKLISLDSLSKNKSNSLEDKLNQPIIANAAAATFVQEKDQIQAAVKQSVKGSSMSFAGIDGLHKPSMMSSVAGVGGFTNTMQMMPPSTGMINPSVMGGSGNISSSMIGMLDPNEMMNRKPTTSTAQGMPQQQGMMTNMMPGMMMNPMAGTNNNMMMMNPMAGNTMMMPQPQQMGMNGNITGSGIGMMNSMPMPQQQQQQPAQFGGMMNQGYGNMPGMTPQQGMGMAQQGMSGGGQNWNMSGGMGQQPNNSGMGGQPPMGGFR
jgi:epsin